MTFISKKFLRTRYYNLRVAGTLTSFITSVMYSWGNQRNNREDNRKRSDSHDYLNITSYFDDGNRDAKSEEMSQRCFMNHEVYLGTHNQQ